MRIYYATKGLRGTPYSSEIINTDIFKVFRGGATHFPADDALRAADAFPMAGQDTGRYTDYEYVCKEGVFYIPRSVCVGEVVEPGHINDYYFVVLCDDAVELRYLRSELQRPWHEQVGEDEPVTNPDAVPYAQPCRSQKRVWD